jgi:hypothetical protein
MQWTSGLRLTEMTGSVVLLQTRVILQRLIIRRLRLQIERGDGRRDSVLAGRWAEGFEWNAAP